jgi:hypothetical protein
VGLTADLLRRWFGDAMLQQPVHVSDLARATVIDLLRILDYPSEFVPVVPVARRLSSAVRALSPARTRRFDSCQVQLGTRSAIFAVGQHFVQGAPFAIPTEPGADLSDAIESPARISSPRTRISLRS